MKPDPYVYGSLIDAYSRNGDFARAEKLLEKQRTHNVLTAHSYTAILNSYLSRGYLARADALLKQMKKHNIAPTLVTYNTLLVNYAERGNLERVHALLAEMESEGHRPDEMLLGRLMTIFSKLGHHDLVERLAVKLPPNATGPSGAVSALLWQSRIHSALKRGDTAAAFGLAQQAVGLGVSLAPNTLGHLVNSLARGGLLAQLDQALEWALNGYRLPPPESFTSAIAAYARADQVDKAHALLHRARAKGAALPSDAFNPIIYEHAARGALDKMEAAVQELYQSSLPFSEVTYRVLLKVFLLIHDQRRAKAIMREIREKAIPLRPNFFNSSLKQLVDEEPSFRD